MNDRYGDSGADPRWTRRDFLRAGALGTLAIGSAGVISRGARAFGQDRALGAGSAAVKRGGQLTIGLSGGGSTEGINPIFPTLSTDYARIPQIYEPLLSWDANLNPIPQLAESVVANKDATLWTIRLRKGVTFHNGKELTADDVIYTFQQVLNPKKPGYGAVSMASVDAKGIKKVDRYTVSVPCSRPFADFAKTLPADAYWIVPEGWTAKQIIGTGPFVLKSFVAGQQSVMDRNPNYWVTGLPYLDSLVMTDFTDEASEVNALIGGQVNAINGLSATSVAPIKNAGKSVLISEGGGFCPFVMRVDVTPFTDVRVRQALRLTVDRPAIHEAVYGGYGALGNDVFGYWDSVYDRSIPQRHQDLDQAKFLLKKAGHENLALKLVIAPLAQGAVGAAELFVQQAKGAGVNITIDQVTDATDANGFPNWHFTNGFWGALPYLTQVGEATLGKASLFNETHFDNAKYARLYNEAIRTLNVDKQREIVSEMQLIDYNSGGYIIPVFEPVIDGFDSSVHGDLMSKSGQAFNNWDLRRFWVE
jgi:peptide/nickel transport system substrate-binding protein